MCANRLCFCALAMAAWERAREDGSFTTASKEKERKEKSVPRSELHDSGEDLDTENCGAAPAETDDDTDKGEDTPCSCPSNRPRDFTTIPI